LSCDEALFGHIFSEMETGTASSIDSHQGSAALKTHSPNEKNSCKEGISRAAALSRTTMVAFNPI
jgi:hypothetical protein